MNLWPSKKQWRKWSLPSKLTAIGALIAMLSLGLYLIEKTFDVVDRVASDDLRPELRVRLEFPYERVGDSVRQNRRNPELTITNTGAIALSPIKVDADMFVFNLALDEIAGTGKGKYITHGHLIFEPELKPGTSVTASLAGVMDWVRPVVYHIRAKMYATHEKKMPDLSLLYLIDKNGIAAEGSGLSKSRAGKLRATILDFENNNGAKKEVTLYAPVNGIWVPYAEPGVNWHLEGNRTLVLE